MTSHPHDTPAADAGGAKPQRAVLVGVQVPGTSDADHESSLAELGRLVTTLGYDVIGQVSQKRSSLANDAVVGTGKLREVARFTGGDGVVTHEIPGRAKTKAKIRAEGLDGDGADSGAGGAQARRHDGEPIIHLPEEERAAFVIVDNELTPTQLKNLETATGVEVMDRTGVIVEIFYRHAKTREARLQVEIARLKYLAPRLRLARGASERQGGGIGAKGVGETAGELDKRRIRDRVAELQRELEDIHASQEGRRSRRSEQSKVALVGYTNAGKSSLMRALTGSEVLVQDKLFATLDTTIRALQPETMPRVLVSDTVGFIKKLPHDLVASFRSTLDEAHDASLLLFVADASDPTFRSQLDVTRETIGEIGASDVTSRLVLNKADRLDDVARAALRREFPDAIIMSAHRKEDVAALRDAVLAHFERDMAEVALLIPYEKSSLMGEIRRSMRVLGEDHGETGTTLTVRASQRAVDTVLAKLR